MTSIQLAHQSPSCQCRVCASFKEDGTVGEDQDNHGSHEAALEGEWWRDFCRIDCGDQSSSEFGISGPAGNT